MNAYSSSYSGWNVDKTWSSQEWKPDELMQDRTKKLVIYSQRASQTRFLVTARTSFWKKQITIKRRDPLLAHSECINSLLKTMRQNQNCR